MRIKAIGPLKEHFALTEGRVYPVIGLTADSFRVIDDEGRPILYPKECFDLVDESVPADWKWKVYSEVEYYADPPELAGNDFYPALFREEEEAVRIFEDYRRSLTHQNGHQPE